MFENKLLDGEKVRIVSAAKDYLKPEVLELREPKNGEAIDSACRTQYAVIGEVLVERYLPPETIGDQWAHDNVGDPWWSVVGHPPHGGVVADFNKYIGGAYLRKLDPEKNVVAYAEDGEEVCMKQGEYLVTRNSDQAELRGNRLASLRQAYYG